MWEAIAYVGSGLTLAAFLAAVVAWTIKSKAEERERLIRTAKADQRADLVRNALEFFHVDTSGLTREQQYNVAIEQIRARAQRFKIAALAVCFLAVVAAVISAYAITTTKNNPPPPRPIVIVPSLVDEVRFRVNQIDEVFATALALQKVCFDQLANDGSIAGSCIRDYLNHAQVVTTAFELGGIYRPPGRDEDTVWIGTSGYGLRHLPSRRSYKDQVYAERDLRDLIHANEASSGGATSSAGPLRELDLSLDRLTYLAKFSETEVLNDWFKRHQAQGMYKDRYGGAYKVYEVRIDDYKDQLTKVKMWLDRLHDEWVRFKGLGPMRAFT